MAHGRRRQSYLFPFAGGEPRPLPGIRPDDKLVKWSRDGRELYVASPSGIPQRIFRVDLTTGTRTLWKEVFPTQPAGVRLSEVAVTPDDRAMHSQLLTNLYVVTRRLPVREGYDWLPRNAFRR